MPNAKKSGELIHQVHASMDVTKGQDHCFQSERGLQNPKNDHGEVSALSTLPFPLPKLSLREVDLATDGASSHTHQIQAKQSGLRSLKKTFSRAHKASPQPQPVPLLFWLGWALEEQA